MDARAFRGHPAIVSVIGFGLAFDRRHRVRLEDGRVLRSVDSRRFRAQPGLAERIHADVASGDLARIRAWRVASNRGAIDADLRAAEGDARAFVAITPSGHFRAGRGQYRHATRRVERQQVTPLVMWAAAAARAARPAPARRASRTA